MNVPPTEPPSSSPGSSPGPNAPRSVMTREEQAALTPQDSWRRLLAGNERFVAGAPTHTDLRAQVAATADQQFPLAFVLTCVDSRVPVETVFDQSIGDVFVGRVAGNVIDEQMLGSVEFATAVAGAPLIVVMGHTSCGAVMGACDGVDLGHVTVLVKAIEPSVKAVAPEGASSANLEQVNAVAQHNAKRSAEEIRRRSEIVRDLEEAGKVMIVAAMYDLRTGEVRTIE